MVQINTNTNYIKVHTDSKEEEKEKTASKQNDKSKVKPLAPLMSKLTIEARDKTRVEIHSPVTDKSKVKAKATPNSKKPPMKVDKVVINLLTNTNPKISEWRINWFIPTLALTFFLFFFVYATSLQFLSRSLYSNDVSDVGIKVLAYNGRTKYVTWPDPPQRNNLAAVARYVMHISEYGSLATNSTHKGIEGYPFVNIFSVSDGPYRNSTGVPYFYLTPMELSVIDIEATNKVSLTVTEAQSNYCNKKDYDPEDPRCAHVIFTGSIKKLEKNSEEEIFAKNALFERHFEMKNWPAGHDWFFAKLDIIHIYLLDYFGGVATVKPEDYYATNPFESDK